MGSDQSRPRRRQSLEYPLNFSSETPLDRLLRLYEQKKGRLEEIINELQQIPGEIQRNVKKAETGRTASIATASVGVGLGILAAPFTGGLSLIIAGTGAAAGVAGAAAGIGVSCTFSKKIQEAERTVQSLTTEFRTIMDSLKEKLRNVERSSEEMRETQTDPNKRMKLLDLELSILRVTRSILSLEPDTSLASVSDVAETFTETLQELDRVVFLIRLILPLVQTTGDTSRLFRVL